MALIIFVIIVLCIILIPYFYFYHKERKLINRKIKVINFRNLLIKMTSDYWTRHPDSLFNSDRNWFLNKWSYEDMVHSKKPLTLESWFTDDELKRINS